MKKLTLFALAAVSILFMGDAALAQDNNSYEVFGGFSHQQIDTGLPDDLVMDNDTGDVADDFFLDDIIDDREGANGFEFGFTGNFNRYIGATTSISGHFKSDTVAFGNFSSDVDTDFWNVLVGLQIKDNAKDAGRFKPFGRVMVGSAIYKQDFHNIAGSTFQDSKFNESGFAASFGGGIDVRAGDDVDIRLFQFDYNPAWVFDGTQHNFRIGVGIVFH